MTTPSAPASSPASHRARRVAVVAGGAVAGAALVYGGLLVTSGGDVAPHTTVVGVDIGGQSQQQARATLDAATRQRRVAPVTLMAGEDAPYTVSPTAAGLTLDIPSTVQAASGRTYNPLVLLRRLFGHPEVAPVITADPARLAAAVAGVADKVDEPVTEGGLTFTPTAAVPVQPKEGHLVDRPAAARAVTDGWLRQPVIELPLTVVAPTVNADQVQAAMGTLGAAAVSAPVTVVADGRAVRVAPATYARYLSTRSENGALVLVADGAGLKKALARPLAGVERPARDATFRLTGARPAIVASQVGQTIDPKALGTAFAAAASLPAPAQRIARVSLVETQPKITTAQANSLGVREKVSSFTTRYPYAAYRLQNIHRAADLIDGTVLLPGQVFSLNGIVGERTAANGFAIGTIINNGRFEKDYGGGTSQVATTTFNAVFFGGYQIITHKPHSFYISRYPAGREATVAWPNVDLKWKNDSPYAVVVDTSYTRSTVTVTLWGTKVWDIRSESGPRTEVKGYATVYDASASCVRQPGVPGFNIVVTRVFVRGGAVVRREPFRTHYNPAANVYCRAAPAPKPSPTPAPSPSPPPSPTPSPKPSPTGTR